MFCKVNLHFLKKVFIVTLFQKKNNIYHTKEQRKEFYIGGTLKWEILAVHVIAKYFGSLSYSYYFSVAVATEVVDVTKVAKI